MAKVKTLIEHTNAYGDAPLKKKGKVYDHPNPKAEIQAKLVELVKAPAKKKDDNDGEGKGSA